MNSGRASFAAAGAVVRRDFLILTSYRSRFFTQLLSVFFSLVLFYYISRLVKLSPFQDSDAYYAFAVVGLVILQILNSTLGTPPMVLRQELVAGTFERLVLSPFGPVAGAASILIFPFVYSLVTGIAMVAFAALVFGVPIEWDTAALAIPVAFLGAASFAPFGIIVLSAVMVFKQAVGGVTWVVAGISLVAGVYFPATLLPGWVSWTSDVQPFTPAVDLMRHLLVGTPLIDSPWLDVAKLVGFGAVLFPMSLLALRAAVGAARRKGTIIEY